MVRFKNRYITLEIENVGKNVDLPLTLRSQDLYNEVIAAVQFIHGDFGSASVKFGFSVKYFNAKTRIAIVRVCHGPHKYVTSSLPFMNKLKDLIVRFRVLYIGATLHHCYKVIVRHQKAELSKILPSLKSEEEKVEIKKKILNLDNIFFKK